MIKFTRTGVFVLTIFIMFILIIIFINQYKIKTAIDEQIMYEQILHEIPVAEKNEIWQLQIPKISLIAEISEGTNKEVLNQHVGHFYNTSKKEGNIGLAAHNTGNEANYFRDLKLLKKGDEIIYRYNGFEKIYEVEKSRIIKNTEWEYLEETEENMLTLITFIENYPEYRRCIQAREKEEKQF